MLGIISGTEKLFLLQEPCVVEERDRCAAGNDTKGQSDSVTCNDRNIPGGSEEGTDLASL